MTDYLHAAAASNSVYQHSVMESYFFFFVLLHNYFAIEIKVEEIIYFNMILKVHQQTTMKLFPFQLV